MGSRLELNRLRMCVSDGLQKLSLWGPFKQTPPQGRPASSEYSPLSFTTLSPRASWEKDEARLKGEGQEPQVEDGSGRRMIREEFVTPRTEGSVLGRLGTVSEGASWAVMGRKWQGNSFLGGKQWYC